MLQIDEQDGWAVVRASGDLDLTTAPRLREAVIGVVVGGQPHVVLDLQSVDFIDSTGLGVLVGRLKLARTRGGSMRLVGTDDRVLKVFAITGLDKVFEIHPDVDSALAAGVATAETS